MDAKAPLAGAALFVVVLVCYIPATRGDFIWDDDQHISQNRALASEGGLRQIWLQPGATPQYYPLVFTTFWIESRIWHLHPVGYHWVNVVLHGMNAVLLWLVLRRLVVPGAWFAAALFALHPVCVESVAWITERKNVLSAFFYGLALLAFLRFAAPDGWDSGKRGSWGWYALALGLFVCALLSKTVACSLPAALVLILWWKRGKVTWNDGLLLLPFFAVGLVLGLTTVWVEKHLVNARGEEWNFSALERCLIAGRALWFYAGKLLWPVNLTFIYPRWSIEPRAAWQHLFPLAAIAVVGVLWSARERLGRGCLVAVLFFAGTLVPALGFFDVYPMRFSFVADHFQYLASAGLFALAAAAAVALVQRWPACTPFAIGLAGGILLCLGVATWRQGSIYRNEEALWQDTLRKNPGAWIAHSILGTLRYNEGKLAEADRHFAEAIRLYPAAWEAHFGLGAIKKRRGEPSAEEEFAETLRLNPKAVLALTEMGAIRISQGQTNEAIEFLSKALQEGPGYGLAHYYLGIALLHLGKPAEALAEQAKAVELIPDNAVLRFGLGVSLYREGQQLAAEAEFRTATTLDPHWPELAREAAWILATDPDAKLRNGMLAVELAQRACEARPDSQPLFLDTLAAAQAEAGQFEAAIATARRALDVRNGVPPQIVRQMEDRLRLYEKHQPFHASPPR